MEREERIKETDLSARLEAKERDCEMLRADLARLGTAARDLRDRYAELAESGGFASIAVRHLSGEDAEALRIRLEELIGHLRKKGEEAMKLRRELDQHRGENERLAAELRDMTGLRKEAEERIRQLAKKGAATEPGESAFMLNALSRENNSLKAQLRRVLDESGVLREALARAGEHRKDIEGKLERFEREQVALDALSLQAGELDIRLKAKEAECVKLNDWLTAKESEAAAIGKARERLERTLNETENERDWLKTELGERDGELAEKSRAFGLAEHKLEDHFRKRAEALELLEQMTDHFENAKTALEESERERERFAGMADRCEADLEESLGAEKKEAERYKAERDEALKSVSALDEERKKLALVLDGAQGEAASVGDTIAKIREKHGRASARLERARLSLEERDIQIARLKAERNDLERRLGKLDEWREKIEYERHKRMMAEERLKALQREFESGERMERIEEDRRRELDDRDGREESLARSLDQSKTTVSSLQAHLAEIVLTLGKKEGDFAAAREAVGDLKREILERDREIVTLTHKLEGLKDTKA